MPQPTTRLLDSTGDLVERYEYSSHGKRQVFSYAGNGTNDPLCLTARGIAPRVLDGPFVDDGTGLVQPYSINPFGHQGLYHDEHLGPDAIQNRARDRRSAGFLQRDPLGYPDGMNTYAAYHVMDGGVDPSGHFTYDAEIEFRGGQLHKTGLRTPNLVPLANVKFSLDFGCIKDRSSTLGARVGVGGTAGVTVLEMMYKDAADELGKIGSLMGMKKGVKYSLTSRGQVVQFGGKDGCIVVRLTSQLAAIEHGTMPIPIPAIPNVKLPKKTKATGSFLGLQLTVDFVTAICCVCQSGDDGDEIDYLAGWRDYDTERYPKRKGSYELRHQLTAQYKSAFEAKEYMSTPINPWASGHEDGRPYKNREMFDMIHFVPVEKVEFDAE